jgi:hypothetical protein
MTNRIITAIAIIAAAILIPASDIARASHGGETWFTSYSMETTGSGSSRRTWTTAHTGVDAGGALLSYTAVKPTITKQNGSSQSRTKVCNLAAACTESSPWFNGAGTYRSEAAHWYQVSGHNRVNLPNSGPSAWYTLN